MQDHLCAIQLRLVVHEVSRLKNGAPQGSVTPSLQHYISGLPTTVSRKYACADDLAIMHADGYWQAVEWVLSKNNATVR